MAKFRLMFVLVLCALLSSLSFGMYDAKVGRFMQRDPLGIDPAGNSHNPFKPNKQYTDGLNVYEYVKSDSINSKDAFGLIATPWPPAPPATSKYTDKACCKIETTHIARYSGSGYYPVVSGYTTCNQVTINSKGARSFHACKCHYKKRPNVHVYDSHPGECCWCTVEMKGVKSVIAGLPLHFWIIVRCEKDPENDYLITIFYDNFIVGNIDSDDRVDTGVTLRKGKISCSNAAVFKEAFDDAETRFWTGLFCFGNAWSGFSYMTGQCP